MSLNRCLVLVFLFLSVPASLAAGEIRVDCNFPGGNIIVEGVDEDVIRLRQDRRDTSTWWFYWCFRVRGAEGQTLRFDFTDGQPIGVRGPAVSTDGGQTWAWLGADSGNSRSFSYRFSADQDDVRFAYTIPYLQSDWQRFLAAHKDNARLRAETLCRSRKGRPVECAYVGSPNTSPQHRVLITARHHACESMASFALEEVVRTILTGDTEEGRWLAENVEMLVVPFVDKDGVEDGDQGKNRRPRDHNRDYSGQSIYPETAALCKLVPKWNNGKLHLTLDLHCPWIRGKHNEEIYIVGSSDKRIWAEQQRFGKILEETCTGTLPYRAADNLAFGTAWNTGGNYSQGTSFSRWAGGLPSVRLAASFELPYANARGAVVNAESARAFGRDLARALGRYLESTSDERR